MNIVNNRNFIKWIKKNPEHFYIIHYSCQSLYDDSDNDNMSPKITSIAISHVQTEQTISFSTHSIAEELNIPRHEVYDEFDKIEKQLLEQFYNFVRDRRDKFWIHWNMRNLTFGFEHLEHRYKVLGGINPSVIPVERRINLNDIISRMYGSDYAQHPKLISLMELNGGRHRHFLSGEEEVEAFNRNEFIKMHNSTLCKVGFFLSAIKKMVSGRLRTASNGWGVQIDRLFESRGAKTAGFFGTILGIVLGLHQIWSMITSP